MALQQLDQPDTPEPRACTSGRFSTAGSEVPFCVCCPVIDSPVTKVSKFTIYITRWASSVLQYMRQPDAVRVSQVRKASFRDRYQRESKELSAVCWCRTGFLQPDPSTSDNLRSLTLLVNDVSRCPAIPPTLRISAIRLFTYNLTSKLNVHQSKAMRTQADLHRLGPSRISCRPTAVHSGPDPPQSLECPGFCSLTAVVASRTLAMLSTKHYIACGVAQSHVCDDICRLCYSSRVDASSRVQPDGVQDRRC